MKTMRRFGAAVALRAALSTPIQAQGRAFTVQAHLGFDIR